MVRQDWYLVRKISKSSQVNKIKENDEMMEWKAKRKQKKTSLYSRGKFGIVGREFWGRGGQEERDRENSRKDDKRQRREEKSGIVWVWCVHMSVCLVCVFVWSVCLSRLCVCMSVCLCLFCLCVRMPWCRVYVWQLQRPLRLYFIHNIKTITLSDDKQCIARWRCP